MHTNYKQIAYKLHTNIYILQLLVPGRPPKSSKENPRWDCVEVCYRFESQQYLTLEFLKEIYTPEDLMIIRKGNRLSIVPVPEKTAKDILTRLEI